MQDEMMITVIASGFSNTGAGSGSGGRLGQQPSFAGIGIDNKELFLSREELIRQVPLTEMV